MEVAPRYKLLTLLTLFTLLTLLTLLTWFALLTLFTNNIETTKASALPKRILSSLTFCLIKSFLFCLFLNSMDSLGEIQFLSEGVADNRDVFRRRKLWRNLLKSFKEAPRVGFACSEVVKPPSSLTFHVKLFMCLAN